MGRWENIIIVMLLSLAIASSDGADFEFLALPFAERKKYRGEARRNMLFCARLSIHGAQIHFEAKNYKWKIIFCSLSLSGFGIFSSQAKGW
jgi:hypothetical protein